MTEQQFKLGDVVELKSRGPAMTISSISEDGKTIDCSWFDKQGQRQREEFLPSSLKPFARKKVRLSAL